MSTALAKGNARSSGYERETHDWYVEPRHAIDALLDVETFPEPIWDPACGGGNIVVACRERGMSAYGSDMADRGFGATNVDFLGIERLTPSACSIITNPPFKLAVAFALHALEFAPRVAILQRTTWLEGEARYQALFSRGHLARVWQFRRRISMPPGGVAVPATGGSVAFAWFVFERGHSGPATLGWLP